MVLLDLVRTVNAPDFPAWESRIHRLGGCANPKHLRGYTRVRDGGRVVSEFSSASEPGGVALVACRNRRASRCPTCSRLYGGDVYALTLAGMAGGKGVPVSVTRHPMVFATFTAPGFGAVHSARTSGDGSAAPCRPRRSEPCEHGMPTRCLARHSEEDGALGAPLCAACYDYRGAVVWQASMGALWARFTIYLPRHLAASAGLTQRQVRDSVRISYVKIVEFQRRGLVHVHAVIRADGKIPGEPPPRAWGGSEAAPPPDWLSADLLGKAIRSAAGAVAVPADAGEAGSWTNVWGVQLDVAEIEAAVLAGEGVGEARVSRAVARYLAKYATKGTEATGWDHRGPDGTARAAHAERMVATAWELARVPELAGLNLHRVARELGYRGHVSSKSRWYSTTLTALREERARFTRERFGSDQEALGEGAVRESQWRFVGAGYTPGQALIAAGVARDKVLNDHSAREAEPRPGAGGRATGRTSSARQRESGRGGSGA